MPTFTSTPASREGSTTTCTCILAGLVHQLLEKGQLLPCILAGLVHQLLEKGQLLPCILAGLVHQLLEKGQLLPCILAGQVVWWRVHQCRSRGASGAGTRRLPELERSCWSIYVCDTARFIVPYHHLEYITPDNGRELWNGLQFLSYRKWFEQKLQHWKKLK